MSFSLADEFRKLGIVSGDLVETISAPDSLDESLSGAVNEPKPAMLGYLIEITALGENVVIGYPLSGTPHKEDEDGYAYRLYKWERSTKTEMTMSGPKVRIRKVGSIKNGIITWTMPNLSNVYARAKKGVK